jgi:metal-dependent amidase/aminoacylase/carboxypeptidase family protein
VKGCSSKATVCGPIALGEETAAEGPGTLGSEGFSAFSNTVPAYLGSLGGGTAEDGLPYMHHHPEFDIVENCLASGAWVEVRIIADYLGGR